MQRLEFEREAELFSQRLAEGEFIQDMGLKGIES